MNTHAAQPSTVQVIGGVDSEPVSGLVTHGMLAAPRDHLMDAVAANQEQARWIYNPDPEINSLVEHLTEMLRHGADLEAVHAEIAKALPLVRRTWESNATEGQHQREALGPIDGITAMLHLHGRRKSLGLVDAARYLRDPLKVIRRARTEQVPFQQFFEASCRVKDVIGELTVEELRGPTMREKLGTRRDGNGLHDVLCALLTDGAPAEEAA